MGVEGGGALFFLLFSLMCTRWSVCAQRGTCNLR